MSEELPYDFSNCDMKTMGYEKTGRKSGFYFIKSKWDDRFEPAEWSLHAECWALIGEERLFKDSDFIEIDERPIEREVKPLPEYRK